MPFVRAKLRRSLGLACAKAGLSDGEIECLAAKIASPFEASEADIQTADIRRAVLAELKTACPVGYVRYSLAGTWDAKVEDLVIALMPFLGKADTAEGEPCRSS